MINEHQVLAYLESMTKPTYSRNQYDQFLKAVKFKFNRPAIHITGTNGKGSLAYFLNETFINAGYKVGRFTSPSLKTPNEMVTINHVEMSNHDFAFYINKYQTLFEQYGLTYFEILTFITLSYFKDQRVDLAVIEVGMGGTIDATNIFKPILSIITNVTIEHSDYLGKTLKEIATDKAGIIKPKVPVVLGPMSVEAFNTIANVAIQKQSFIYGAAPTSQISVDEEGIRFDTPQFKNLVLSIPARYEVINASIALTAIEVLAKKFPVSTTVIYDAFKKVNVPGRFSVIKKRPLVIVDGAHNPGAMTALLNSVKSLTNHPIKVVFAAFKDKDVNQEFDLLSLSNAHVLVTTFDHPRARHKADYPALSYPFDEDYKHAIISTIQSAKEEEVVLITGSLYFALKVYDEFKEGV